jgi:hypothetical protein
MPDALLAQQQSARLAGSANDGEDDPAQAMGWMLADLCLWSFEHDPGDTRDGDHYSEHAKRRK